MSDEAEESERRGVAWLADEQGEGGGWHSATYGQLKDGAATTALVLYALAHAGNALLSKYKEAIDRGFAFFDRGLAKRGTLAAPDGSLDFPTYASALWLVARGKLRLEKRRAEAERLVQYLVEAQVAEKRGFASDSASYGGWDFLGQADAQGITTGTNISVTRFVLQALALEKASGGRPIEASGGRPDLASGRRQPPKAIDSAIALGKSYVLRCQQPDGGFAFTCEPASLNNKAAYADPELNKPRSYGTATCDGLLALLACGRTADDEPVRKALGWIDKHRDLARVPGFAGLPPESGWDVGLRYYYYAALASVLARLPVTDRDDRRTALARHVVSLQAENGCWINESDRMRENDPLIATPLAVMALTS